MILIFGADNTALNKLFRMVCINSYTRVKGVVDAKARRYIIIIAGLFIVRTIRSIGILSDRLTVHANQDIQFLIAGGNRIHHRPAADACVSSIVSIGLCKGRRSKAAGIRMINITCPAGLFFIVFSTTIIVPHSVNACYPFMLQITGFKIALQADLCIITFLQQRVVVRGCAKITGFIQQSLAKASIVIPILFKMTSVQESLQMVINFLFMVQGHNEVSIFITTPGRICIDFSVRSAR